MYIIDGYPKRPMYSKHVQVQPTNGIHSRGISGIIVRSFTLLRSTEVKKVCLCFIISESTELNRKLSSIYILGWYDTWRSCPGKFVIIKASLKVWFSHTMYDIANSVFNIGISLANLFGRIIDEKCTVGEILARRLAFCHIINIL